MTSLYINKKKGTSTSQLCVEIYFTLTWSQNVIALKFTRIENDKKKDG